ncbi:MAG: methyltransferase domain-containing protein [Bradyrhizobium sp.]|nr:MAG: methyltransferase domain-containing protein [Bradyrhizobium sp.]
MSVAPLPRCRFCRAPLTTSFVDLGETPLANSYITADDVAAGRERRYPLHARVCDACFLVQVDDVAAPEAIFSDYAYFSSMSDTWVAHARRYAEAMIERFRLGPGSQVVEIASNDGYLLQHFIAANVPALGIEPAANVAATAVAKGVPTEVVFFGKATAEQLVARGLRADLTAANNVLAHVPDIRDFVAGFAVLLAPEGVATFEFPHLLNLIREVQFDTIYHEHFSYLSLIAVEAIFSAEGLRVFDVETLPTHGGSLRLYVCHAAASHKESDRLIALRNTEREAGLGALPAYRGFAPRVEAVKRGFLEFLTRARDDGKRVAAYGAAAKGNTFLNVCGVGAADIVCVFDRAAAKQGRLTPGSHIPIRSPATIGELRPDYLVVLPWNLIDEIRAQMAEIGEWGGRFVVALPELRVLPP